MPREMTYRNQTRTVSDAHPAADKLPWNLDGDDFPAMVADMDATGFDPEFPVLRSPEGFLVNGRRREFAALLAGVEPVYREVDWSEEEIILHVQRTDLNRRSLTPSQRAAVAVELADLLPQGGDRQSDDFKGNRFPLKSSADIASAIHVSEKTVDAAAKVKKQAPELLDAVKEGKLSAKAAAKAADLPAADRQAIAAAPDPKAAAKAKAKPVPPPESPAPEPPAVAADAHPADAYVAAVNRICVAIDKLKAEVQALAADPWAGLTHIPSVTDALAAARKALWQGRPTEPCAMGAGVNRSDRTSTSRAATRSRP